MLPKAYLDTNIIIDYCWWKYFSDNGEKTNSVKLIERGIEGKFEIFYSTFTIMEVAQHFREWFLLEKTIKRGFSYREFNRQKVGQRMDEKQKEGINRIISDLQNAVWSNSKFVVIDKMGKKFFRIVQVYMDNYMDFLDAIHINIALDSRCTYFITADTDCRARIQHMMNEKIIIEKIELPTVSTFLKII